MTEQIINDSSVIQAKRQSVTIYGCGGTGVDLVRQYITDPIMEDTLSQRAVERFAFFDTSLANLQGVEKSKAFLVNGTNGGGSDRSRNAQIIVDSVKPFLLDFKPSDLNIVVYSVSGGTGSVAGPAIVEELISRGESVVSIITVGVETVRGCENSYRTFLGLERLAEKHNKPVVFTYATMDARRDTKEAYLYQLKCIGAISHLASGRNLRLDAADVENLFTYTNVTNRPGSLALLDVLPLPLLGDAKVEDNYISSATLLRDDTIKGVFVNSEYGKTGYYATPSVNTGLLQADGWFFGISVDNLNSRVIKNLEDLKKNADQQSSVVKRVSSLSSKELSGDTVEGSTLFL